MKPKCGAVTFIFDSGRGISRRMQFGPKAILVLNNVQRRDCLSKML